MVVYILGNSAGEAAKCDVYLVKIPFTGRASLNTCLSFLRDPREQQQLQVTQTHRGGNWDDSRGRSVSKSKQTACPALSRG